MLLFASSFVVFRQQCVCHSHRLTPESCWLECDGVLRAAEEMFGVVRCCPAVVAFVDAVSDPRSVTVQQSTVTGTKLRKSCALRTWQCPFGGVDRWRLGIEDAVDPQASSGGLDRSSVNEPLDCFDREL